MVKSSGSNYKWYILSLGTLIYIFVCSIPRMCMPVLFPEIMEDLNLSLVQVGLIWGLTSMAGTFGLVAGLLGDRFGARRVIAIGCLLAGLAGASRGLAGDFSSLAVTMFLFGLVVSLITINMHKMSGIWFPSKQLGQANGILALGMAVGMTVGPLISATIISPLLGGWKNVMFLYGAIPFVLTILWFISHDKLAQDISSASHESRVPLLQSLLHVVRIKGVWILGLITLGYGGGFMGMLGYLPIYLRRIGWTAASADISASAFNASSMIGTIPITLLSDRLGTRKWILFVATIVTGIGIGFIPLADGTLVWVLVIIAGIVKDGFMGVFLTTIFETEGVGATYAGTAIGLVMTLSRLGGTISPPMGNSLASINLGLPFVLWAAMAFAASVCILFLKDTVKRGIKSDD